MSMPSVQVQLGFSATVVDPLAFVLNSSTLGGPAMLEPTFLFEDVSTYSTGQIQITRGRSRETTQHQAGTAALALRNEDRRFDPTNTASPYYPGIGLRAPVAVSLAGQQIYGGYVDSYQPLYVQPKTATVSVNAIDGFSLLANANLHSYGALQESSGARIYHVIHRSEVRFPGDSNLDEGVMRLQASLQNQVAALGHCQTAVASEGGVLYCLRDGTLRFQDQNYSATAIAAHPNGVLTFTDTGTGPTSPYIGYEDVGMQDASVILFNQATGTRTGGVQQQADDLASQSLYGIRSLSLPTLENISDADVAILCGIYVARYKDPEIRFDHIGVELSGLSGANQSAVAALDLGSVVTVIRTPPGGGSAIQQLAMVELMTWQLDATVRSAKLTLGLMTI